MSEVLCGGMVTLYAGDALDSLRQMPSDSVHVCVTSPPYWGLRSYLPKGHERKPLELGQEPTPDAYVAKMVELFREVRRVLHPSGTLWLNLGDSYAGGGGWTGVPDDWQSISSASKQNRFDHNKKHLPGLKPKDLCLIPERLLIALQADGWWVRSKIVWHKKSCMPESVTDRPTNSWEPIFLLAKSQRYFFDCEAIKEPAAYDGRQDTTMKPSDKYSARNIRNEGESPNSSHTEGAERWPSKDANGVPVRNMRNVWSLSPEPYAEAHFATFPREIPRRAILAGTSARGCCPKCLRPWVRVVELTGRKVCPPDAYGRARVWKCEGNGQQEKGGGKGSQGFFTNESRTLGWQPGCECGGEKLMDPELEAIARVGLPIPCTVLDPFAGSGRTLTTAVQLRRHAVGIELHPAYCATIRRVLAESACETPEHLPLKSAPTLFGE